MLNDIIKENIKIHSRQEYPKECCGLIVEMGKSIVSIPTKNISDDPEQSFIIDTEQVLKYGLENIVGYYHSHKEIPDFSSLDIAFSEKLKKPCILYVSDKDVFKEYQPLGIEIPYENRDFWAGFLDCISLFEDYYRRELNIIFPYTINHPIRYDQLYWRQTNKKESEIYKNITILEDFFITNGFVEVKTLQKHDVILTQSFQIDFPAHLSIYVGNNKILSYIGSKSGLDIYKNSYKRMTKHIFRHKSLS